MLQQVKKSSTPYASLLRQSDKANDLVWDKTVPFYVRYGAANNIIATGVLNEDLADELRDVGLLIRNSAGILEFPGGTRLLTKEEVEGHVRGIESYALKKRHIKALRGERLYLADEVRVDWKNEYASYDRNLDILGFMVHSVAIITHQVGGHHDGDLIVARRNPKLVAAKRDSVWDILSGAIEYGATPFETLKSEAEDEFGLNAAQMQRAVSLASVTTHRTRDNPHSIVRETMQVGLLGLAAREFHALECRDVKKITITDEHGELSEEEIYSNVEFLRVSPKKMLERLAARKHLKNGKALAMLRGLDALGYLPASMPQDELRRGLARPSHLFCGERACWVEPQRPLRLRDTAPATAQR